MKKIQIILMLGMSILFFYGCQSNDKPKNTTHGKPKTEKAPTADLKKIEIDIEGMTCEIGCARLIESKLSKTKGIKFVDINFEQKLGQIEYDANSIDPEEIADVVKNIAGGDLYRVTQTKPVDKFSTFR